MQLVDRETVGEQGELATSSFAEATEDEEGTESTERKTPKLSAEQREWLNTVFIPNFRAELIRTLKPEDLAPRKTAARKVSRRAGESGAGESRRARSTVSEHGARKDSPTSSGKGEGAAVEEPVESAGAPDSDAAEQAADRVGELEGENKRLRAALAETRVDRELVWAAASQHAINPAQVAHLLSDRVQLDRNLDPIVVNANGDRAYDRYGRPVTVVDAVRAFLGENPHLVRPSTQLAGGGSGGTDATARTRRVAAVTGGDLIEEALREGL